MRFLGKLRGGGTLTAVDGAIGPVQYELDGYLMRPGAMVASGELHMASGALPVDRHGLRLITAEGRSLPFRFTGKLSDRQGQFAHIDVSQELPSENEWRRLSRLSASLSSPSK